MKTFLALELLVASAISLATAARIVDPYKFAEGHPISEGYDITWKQTQEPHTGEYHGGLGSSLRGIFPKVSEDKLGLGCGVDWGHGLVHAGINGGDGHNGIGTGIVWDSHALSSIVGLRFKEIELNLNVTITEWNEVLFNINNVDLDLNQILMAASQVDPGFAQGAQAAKEADKEQDPLLAQAPPTAKGDGEGQ